MVPISAQLKYNIEVICEFICKKIPVPDRDFSSSARLIGVFSVAMIKQRKKNMGRRCKLSLSRLACCLIFFCLKLAFYFSLLVYSSS